MVPRFPIWGGGNFTSVRVNNYGGWSPFMQGGMPYMSNCCGGNNRMLNTIMGFGLLSNFMNNMFSNIRGQQTYYPAQQSYFPTNPYQQSFYPGLQLNSQNPYMMSQYGDQMDMMNLQSLFPDYRFGVVGGKYIARSKDETLYADSIEELSDLLVSGAKRTKKTEVAEVADSEVSAEGAGDSRTTVTTADDTTSTETAAAETNTAAGKTGRKSPKGWYPASADQNSTIKGLSIDNINKNKSHFTAAEYVTREILKSKSYDNDYSYVKLAEFVVNNNKSVFKEDGSLREDADMTKLDVPDSDWLTANKGKFPISADSKRNGEIMAELIYDVNKQATKACNTTGAIGGMSDIPASTSQYVYGGYKWQGSSNYLKTTISHPVNKKSGIQDSDAILVINGKSYNIHSGNNTCDFYSLINGCSSNPINRYNLISQGHFDPNTNYIFKLTDLNGNDAGMKMMSETINGKKYFVLICGQNRFSMDDVMAGNIPAEYINGKPENPYAIWRS